MPIDLTGVNAKLGRAEEHLNTLENEISTWVNSNGYRHVESVNSDCTEYSIVIRRKTSCEMPVTRWALLAGDCIHNLRSALDHLVYSVAVANTGKNPPPNGDILQFPIYSGERASHKFASYRGKIEPDTLPLSVWTVLDQMQPNIRKHPVIPPLLSILSNFDNTDKHQTLRIACVSPEQVDIGFAGPNVDPRTTFTVFSYYGPIEDGTKIHSTILSRPTPNMKYDRINIDMVVAVWHGKRDPSDPPWKERSPVDGLLREITSEVKSVIAEIVDVAKL